MNLSTPGAWPGAGVGFTALFWFGFLVAGFISPRAPLFDAGQIGQFYREDPVGIRVGLLLATLASALLLLLLWVAATGVQMRRLEEGRHSLLTFAQTLASACLVLQFLYPFFVWQTAASRNDRNTQFVQLLNDLGRLPFPEIACTAVLQGVVIGALILLDKRPNTLFPHLTGYFTIWVTLVFAPASCAVKARWPGTA